MKLEYMVRAESRCLWAEAPSHSVFGAGAVGSHVVERRDVVRITEASAAVKKPGYML